MPVCTRAVGEDTVTSSVILILYATLLGLGLASLWLISRTLFPQQNDESGTWLAIDCVKVSCWDDKSCTSLWWGQRHWWGTCSILALLLSQQSEVPAGGPSWTQKMRVIGEHGTAVKKREEEVPAFIGSLLKPHKFLSKSFEYHSTQYMLLLWCFFLDSDDSTSNY